MALEPVERHPWPADTSFDGGDLDCGNGLLLLIRQHLDPLAPGQLLEFRSVEISVEEDFPAWCRLTGNELVSFTKHGRERSFLVCKGPLSGRAVARARSGPPGALLARPVVAVRTPATLPAAAPARAIPALAVMGIGSWPRPRWMLRAMHVTSRPASPTTSSRPPPTMPCAWPSPRSSAPASTSSPTASSVATTTRASWAGGWTTASSSR